MATEQPIYKVFDGHNDVLLSLYLKERGGDRSFFERSDHGHIDLPRAWEGGLRGGFFAIFTPNPDSADSFMGGYTETANGYEVRLPPPLEQPYALQFTVGVLASLFRLAEQSAGQVRVIRTADELDATLGEGTAGDGPLAVVAHIEGAEAIDPALDALYVLHAAGLRSLGPVWSRPNAFGHGVQFKFPATPDTGPGLTQAGRALVRACNQLGVLIDLAHITEQGFWDVAALTDAPLVVTHTAAHALSPFTRNLTDKQLDAVRESDGVVGVIFGVGNVRADGRNLADTPLDDIVRHAAYIADRVGIDHIALGSDFDGTSIPQALGDVAGLPKLIAALNAHGFDDAALHKITHANWQRALRRTWKPGA